MKMRVISAAYYFAAQFHPGMRFETVRVLARADPQVRGNPAHPEQPPQHKRSFETIGANEKMSCHGFFHSGNHARGFMLPGTLRR